MEDGGMKGLEGQRMENGGDGGHSDEKMERIKG